MSLSDALATRGDTLAAGAVLNRVRSVAGAVGLSNMFETQTLPSPSPIPFGDTTLPKTLPPGRGRGQ
jgi:hypothetical protein